jgi:glycosyltransferase involved in cell wall biosynthesis
VSEKKRLVIVSGSYPRIRCGVSDYVQRVAEQTATLNRFDLHVVTAADQEVNPNLAKGYTVHPTIKSFSLFSANDLCREVLKHNPDIVHIQNPTIKYAGWRSPLMSIVAKKLKNKRPNIQLVVMQHEIAIGRPLLRRRYRPLFSFSDAITVSNDRDRQAIIDLKIDPKKIHIAPITAYMPLHPSDPEIKKRCRKTFDIAQDALCLAYFGFVHPGRHLEPLIRSMACLQSRGFNVYAIIMGAAAQGSEGYFKTCQNLCVQLGLAEKVIWTGYATNEQIADGLSAADVFVSLPDRGADMRNTSIHTGMVAGLPIVTRRNPKYYIDKQIEGMGCFMVEGLNSELLADTIQRAAEDPPSQEFRRRLAQWLDPERIWKQHIEANCRAYDGKRPKALTEFGH